MNYLKGIPSPPILTSPKGRMGAKRVEVIGSQVCTPAEEALSHGVVGQDHSFPVSPRGDPFAGSVGRDGTATGFPENLIPGFQED